MFLISGSYFGFFEILISWNVRKGASILFTGHLVYICMDDLSFQESKVYPRLLLISLHGDLKPTSQATQHSTTVHILKLCTFRMTPRV